MDGKVNYLVYSKQRVLDRRVRFIYSLISEDKDQGRYSKKKDLTFGGWHIYSFKVDVIVSVIGDDKIHEYSSECWHGSTSPVRILLLYFISNFFQLHGYLPETPIWDGDYWRDPKDYLSKMRKEGLTYEIEKLKRIDVGKEILTLQAPEYLLECNETSGVNWIRQGMMLLSCTSRMVVGLVKKRLKP